MTRLSVPRREGFRASDDLSGGVAQAALRHQTDPERLELLARDRIVQASEEGLPEIVRQAL